MSWARRGREAPPTERRDGIDDVKFVSGTNNAMIKVESVVTSSTFRTHSWCSIKTFTQLTSIHWAGPTSLSSIAALGESLRTRQIQFIWSEKWDARTLHTSEITTSGKCQTDWDKHRGSSDVKWKKARRRQNRRECNKFLQLTLFSSPSPLSVKFHFPFASFSSSAFDSFRCFNLHISPRWWEHLHSAQSTARRIIAQPENENKLADGLFGGFCLDSFFSAKYEETLGVF